MKKLRTKLRARRITRDDVAKLLSRRDEQPQPDDPRAKKSAVIERGVSASGRRE
jgi:hypothetical protein